MTPPQWTADIEIDAALAARVVALQFPAFADAPVEAFGFGWDNAAFLVDGRVLFRFPRRRACAILIEREIAFLPEIAARVPWAFAGYLVCYPIFANKTVA